VKKTSNQPDSIGTRLHGCHLNSKPWSRRRLLKGAGAILSTGLAGSGFNALKAQGNPKMAVPRNQKRPQALLGNKRRLLYNYDAWGPFLKGHSIEKINENIDVFSNTQITTVMLSPNAGQSLTYPSKVGEMCHSRELTQEQQAVLYKGMGEVFGKATEGIAALWQKQRIDAFGLLVQRAQRQGLEVFGSFRMNDVHMAQMQDGQGPYTDRFYREHAKWRVPGSWALNYGIPEVRQYRLAQLEELVRRYPLHGLELDFLRGIPYFSSDLVIQSELVKPETATRSIPGFPRDMAEMSAPLMTAFVKDVRRMTERVSRETGRRILLSARVPSSLSGCRRVGLDPIAWHQEGCLDFLTVGYFLHLFYDLPIDEFKAALPKFTIYGSVDYIVGGPYIDKYLYARDGSAEIYRGAAAALLARGADGVMLFNMYVCRGNDPDPKGKDWRHDEPVEVLKDLRDLDSLEGKAKLYLVDYRFDLFDRPFYDVKAQLPQETAPDLPLVTRMCLGEKRVSNKKLTLRVVAERLAPEVVVRVQMNGVEQEAARPATQSHLFPEPYDQMPLDLKDCLDFSIRPEDARFGMNEVTVLSSVRLKIMRVELAIV